MKKTVCLFSISLLSACAKGPEAIVPVSMGNAFVAMPCTQAEKHLVDERATLTALEQKQRNTQVGDAIGVFLVLVPLSSVTGNDVEGEIATSKGKVIALEQRLLTC